MVLHFIIIIKKVSIWWKSPFLYGHCNYIVKKPWFNQKMAKPRPKTCHNQILQLFSIFRFFLWFRYTNAIDWNTSFASPVTLSMFFTMGVWLRFPCIQTRCQHESFEKFNFSFSSTLIKIIMCLSCKRVVVASVYQRSFNLIHYFFQNRSLTLNMSEIGTPPLYFPEWLCSTSKFMVSRVFDSGNSQFFIFLDPDQLRTMVN